MQRQPLPKLIDARKFAAGDNVIHAHQAVAELPRLCAGLASERGEVLVDLRFFRDEQGFQRIDGQAEADVDVVCQRCLEIMPLQVRAEFQLAMVWTDAQAKALPKSLDPLIVGEDGVVLPELLQDELILTTPFVNYHDPAQCAAPSSAVFAPGEGHEVEEETESPFSVLGSLKPRD